MKNGGGSRGTKRTESPAKQGQRGRSAAVEETEWES